MLDCACEFDPEEGTKVLDNSKILRWDDALNADIF